MAITKRAGRTKQNKEPPPKRGGGGIKKATFDTTKKKEVGVSDLTLLSKVSEEAINENLKKRFENGIIYTYIGHVLISVNPFRDLGIYTEEVLNSYKGKNRLEVPPHVYSIAETMYYNMKSYNENQCVIISGESGAGKTEAAKRIMQYIASVSGESSSGIQKIKDMVLATNPLLESFGCAKTLRNDNSSRHGKYLEIQFNRQGEPIGANITNYLLEKARVVGQIREERNFHIFYQFTKAASDNHRQIFGIQGPETYVYTSASKCTSVASIDDVKDFKETLNAMQIIGIGQDEQDQVFRMLATILWIGNIDFIENDEGNSTIRDTSVTNFVAYLMEVDAEAVEKALTLRIIDTGGGMMGRRGSVYESPMNRVQALAVRDALAKAIYDKLFDWIVERVNQSLRSSLPADKTVGILDIYGFEIFDNNSFEQICINYVNEKLQQIFIELTLKAEQDEYVREQITWTPIKYFNNKVVCDLIEERRPPGIFSALNDACATAHADSVAADQNFAQKLSFLSTNPHFGQRQSKFLIKHYAGDVMYDIQGMTDKNKDQLLKDLLILVAKSGNQFLTSIFPDQGETTKAGRRPPTASDKIKLSANALTHTLSMAQPSYIRTIKPNQSKSPTEYVEKQVLHQVKYLGLQENVRIRRAGFAYRQTFEIFTERFYLLSPKTSYAGDFIWTGDSKTAVLQILRDTSIPASEFQMGTTKIFIKTPETLFALEHMRDQYWHNMAARIQRAWRRYMKFKADQATKIQRWWREIKGRKKWDEIRDKGHTILAGRKERRTYSLVGYRRFHGDYLACNDKKSSGGFMMKQVGINERVNFSCDGEVLLSKFGRSSQRLDRVFVLTAGKFYIIRQQVLNGQLQVALERSIPVSSIRAINLSSMRDDWFSFSLGSSTEPDPLLWCVFKTELATWLNVPVKIEPTIQYCKKPGKATVVKVVREQTAQKYDTYKSGTIHVPPGEPANSVSLPVPKPKQRGPRPATQTRRPQNTRPAPRQARPVPQAQALPTGSQPVIPQQPSALQNSYHPSNAQDAAAAAAAAFKSAGQQHSHAAVNPYTQAAQPAAASHVQSHSVPTPARAPQPQTVQQTPVAQKRQSKAAPPPPPPPPEEEKKVPEIMTAKVLYDFQGDAAEHQLTVKAGEIIIIVNKTDNGWWLTQKQNDPTQGWTPSSYVQEIVAASEPKKKPPPPAPPRRPKPSGLNGSPNPSASSSSTQIATNGSAAPGLAEAIMQRRQQNTQLGGGLADALKQRSRANRSDDESDEDW